MRKVFALFLGLALTLSMFSVTPVLAIDVDQTSFDILAETFEWGPAVTAVIIDAGEEVNQAQVDGMAFAVSARTILPSTDTVIYDGPRTVMAAYVSRAKQRVNSAERDTSGNYIVLELKYGFNDTRPQLNGSTAHTYNPYGSATAIAWPLDLYYTVTIDGENVPYGSTIQPIVDDFVQVSNPVEGFTAQKYRMYTPPGSEGKKLPLVLFNHGFGETYREVANGRNNEGQTLVAQEAAITWVTNAPEDTYVLVPQRGTGSQAPGYSRPGVIAFINDLIAQGKVDPDRVYITGLSQGGGETHTFLREYPDMFAAAIPICPLGGSGVTVAQVETFKHVPIWYVHGATDTIVPPTNSTTPYSRLISVGAKDARITIYPAVSTANGNRSVFGTEIPHAEYLGNDGLPMAYYPNGHWSWVMMFNNLYVEDGGIAGSTGKGTTYMDWLFAQRREERVEVLSVVANGDQFNTTTELTITLNKSVPGLSAENILISGEGVSAAGALSNNGNVYILPVEVTKDATITVALSKAGFWFTPEIRNIQVYFVIDFTLLSRSTVNYGSNGNLQVVLLGQQAETYSLEQVRLDSIYLGGTPVARRTNGTPFAVFTDDNRDGLMDLLLHFSIPALRSNGSIKPGDNQLRLVGVLNDGRRIQAVATFQVLPK